MARATFEQRHDVIERGILRGDLGCRFGAREGKAGNILYCPAPASDTPEELDRYAAELRRFSTHDSAGTLIVIPDHDPESFDEGAEQAHALNILTLKACCLANRGMIADLLKSARGDLSAKLRKMDEAQAAKMTEGPAWLSTPVARELMRSKFVMEGPGFLELMQGVRDVTRGMISFVMGPHYKQITNLPHPRFSPHCIYLLNDLMELVVAMGETRALEAVQAWQTAAVGYRYRQGFHIDQVPERIDEEKLAWGPQD